MIYRDHAVAYFAAGWAPLPIRGKWPPPKGWTGNDGAFPSRADVEAWRADEHAVWNVGLRLPDHVIGIDVDTYDGKPGAATFRAALERWGDLPATWTATSRLEESGLLRSGIRLFAVPPGLAWPSELRGGGVEIIRRAHRYAVVWPSLHPEGRTYYWLGPAGGVVDAVPHVDELPDLPTAWVDGLTGGKTAGDAIRADLDDTAAALWIADHGQGVACPAMGRARDRGLRDLFAGGSRHDAAMRATCRVTHLAAAGHPGAAAVLSELRAGFGVSVEGDTARDGGEWGRLVSGAVRLAAGPGEYGQADPCELVSTAAAPFGVVPGAVAAQPATDGPVPRQDERAALPVAEQSPAPLEAVQAALEPAADPAYVLAVAHEVAAQRARRDAKRILDDEDHAKAFREPSFVETLADELAIPDEPETYRIDKVLPTGGNVLLAAQYKVGKTTFINNLARALADAEPFLDAFAVSPLAGRRVALWNYEVGRSQYRTWLRDQAITTSWAVSVLNLRGYVLPLTVPRIQDWCVRWLETHETAVWMVDPFARAFTGQNENDNTEVARFLDALDLIKHRAGVGELVLPTHTGRAEAEEGKERARGATRLDDWADVRWILTRNDEGVRFFSATGRDVSVDEQALHHDELSRRLSLSGGGRQEWREQSLAIKVETALRDQPGLSVNQLRTAIGGKHDYLDAVINDLVTNGRLSRRKAGPGEGRGGGWRLFLGQRDPFA